MRPRCYLVFGLVLATSGCGETRFGLADRSCSIAVPRTGGWSKWNLDTNKLEHLPGNPLLQNVVNFSELRNSTVGQPPFGREPYSGFDNFFRVTWKGPSLGYGSGAQSFPLAPVMDAFYRRVVTRDDSEVEEFLPVANRLGTDYFASVILKDGSVEQYELDSSRMVPGFSARGLSFVAHEQLVQIRKVDGKATLFEATESGERMVTVLPGSYDSYVAPYPPLGTGRKIFMVRLNDPDFEIVDLERGTVSRVKSRPQPEGFDTGKDVLNLHGAAILPGSAGYPIIVGDEVVTATRSGLVLHSSTRPRLVVETPVEPIGTVGSC